MFYAVCIDYVPSIRIKIYTPLTISDELQQWSDDLANRAQELVDACVFKHGLGTE